MNCKAKNIVYESVCQLCNPQSSREEADHGDVQPSGRDGGPREGVYIGESSRSLHERAIEHVRDAGAFSVKSHIVKHWMTSHPSLPNPPKMSFKVTERFRDCLSRQVSEALRISWTEDSILNSKAEYGHNTVSRLSVVEEVGDRKERERLEEEQEEIMKEMVARFKMEKAAHRFVQPSGRRGDITPTGTLCNTIFEDQSENDNKDNENDNEFDSRTENDNENVSPRQTPITNNGPSNVPQVTLGQSNGSPHTPLVYTKGGCGGRDEHPWLKVVHEGVDENDGGLVGGRGVDDKRVDPVIYYETDEDEFLDAQDHSPAVATTREPALVPVREPHRRKNTAKRDVVAPRRGGSGSGYDLAYFKLWWARMHIEGRKQAKEQLKLEEDLKLKVTGGARRMKKYVNVRRGGGPRNQSMNESEFNEKASHQDQLNIPQVQVNLRVGLCLEGGSSVMGEGRGSPVPRNFTEAILEQPRDFKIEKDFNFTSDTGTE